MIGERGAALVTGGGRGIGRAIAERLAVEGWAVGVLARTEAEVEATAEAIRAEGGKARAFVSDVLNPSGLDRALRRFYAWAARLDLFVCATGRLQAIGPLGATDDHEAWWLELETCVRGAQFPLWAVLPLLKKSPHPSVAILVGPGYNGPLPCASAYGAAQAALVRLVESWALEPDFRQIPIFAVYPGLVPTALMESILDGPDGRRWLPQFTEAFAEGKEIGPEAAAEMVAWLADRRPFELSGRVVAAPLSPTVLETRLDSIKADNRGVLRLR
jgi:NAD(P)-dependent dehydrogenase (short-subunit alcohol dehydrogenase family)